MGRAVRRAEGPPASKRKRQQPAGDASRKKQRRQPKPKQRAPPKAPPHPAVPEEVSEGDLSDADLDFVREHTQRLGFLRELKAEELDRKPDKGRPRRVAAPGGSGEEEDPEDGPGPEAQYEARPRRGFGAESGGSGKGGQEAGEQEQRVVLPIKSALGEVLYQPAEAQAAGGDEVPEVAGISVLEDLPPAQPSTVVGKKGKKKLLAGGAPAAAAESPRQGGAGEVSGGESGEEEGLSPVDTASELGDEEEEGEEGGAADGAEERAGAAFGEPQAAAGRGAPGPGAVDESLEAWQQRQERREEAKQRMAAAALKLLQSAEPPLGELRGILALAAGADPVVRRLALVSLLAVFRGLLPGYRIRPPPEAEAHVVLSKDVRRLREHEAGLLRAYQSYLQLLLAAVNARQPGSSGGSKNGAKATGRHPGAGSLATARAAARCLAGLLASAPHFNYASDVLQVLLAKLNHCDGEVAGTALGALRSLLADATAPPVLRKQAVQLVAEMVRARKCAVRAEVGWALLTLDFAEQPGAPLEPVAKDRRTAKAKRKAARLAKARQTAEDRAVTAAFKEAEASADVAEARAAQSDTLEALFEVFFRALKHCSGSALLAPQKAGVPLGAARVRAKFPLLAPTLAGLGRFARLIGIECQADMLAEVQRLAASPRLPLGPRLQCLLAASDILRSQSGALSVDREDLYQALFAALSALPLAPFLDDEGAEKKPPPQGGSLKGASAPSPAGPSSSSSVEALALAVLTRMLVEDGRGLAGARPAAFALRLAAVANFVPPRLACGLLGVLERMLRSSHTLRGLLDAEPGPEPVAPPRGAAGGAQAAESLAAACAAAGTAQLWELALLRATNAHPRVLAAAKAIASLPVGRSSGAGTSTSAVLELFNRPEEWSASAGAPAKKLPRGPPPIKGMPAGAEGLPRFQQLLRSFYAEGLRVADSAQRRRQCAVLALAALEARKPLLAGAAPGVRS